MRRQYGKRANLKTGVTRKQSTPNFPKNEHFLPPDKHKFFQKRFNASANNTKRIFASGVYFFI